jgi:hypothetical protein
MNPRSIPVGIIGWYFGLALLAVIGLTVFTCFQVRLCLRNNLHG